MQRYKQYKESKRGEASTIWALADGKFFQVHLYVRKGWAAPTVTASIGHAVFVGEHHGRKRLHRHDSVNRHWRFETPDEAREFYRQMTESPTSIVLEMRS